MIKQLDMVLSRNKVRVIMSEYDDRSCYPHWGRFRPVVTVQTQEALSDWMIEHLDLFLSRSNDQNDIQLQRMWGHLSVLLPTVEVLALCGPGCLYVEEVLSGWVIYTYILKWI